MIIESTNESTHDSNDYELKSRNSPRSELSEPAENTIVAIIHD